ncbi:MAG: hypothetical protein IJW86_02550 [Clostridia bacterium]|nr:hypothetical protein [Clostridia bacterium]
MKKLKETDIAVIGVIVTVMLYVMNVLGTGVIVGGDIGRIGRGLPFYGFIAPVLFIALAAFVGYYTKKYSMKKAFIAIYVTLVLPFAAYPLALVFGGPLLVIPMFLCMPAGSLFYYLHEEICELINVPTYEATWLMFVIIAVMLIPIIVAPMVYRFTSETEEA